MIFYREANKPFGFEVEWMGELVEARAPIWTIPALVFNWIGGGISSIVFVPLAHHRRAADLATPLGGAVLRVRGRHERDTVVTSSRTSSGARDRPTSWCTPDFGSFPSGHSANAALIATTLGIIFWRTWVWVAGPFYTVLMMLSRTYLGAHWISDTVGGMLVGAGVAVIIWAPFAFRLYRERRLPHPPIWVKVDRRSA